MSRREVRVLVVVCALGAACALGQSVAGVATALLFVAPALALVLFPLLADRYPGEQRLVNLARSRRRRARARQPNPLLPHPAPRQMLPRGGCLIAASLAVRPPPLRPAFR